MAITIGTDGWCQADDVARLTGDPEYTTTTAPSIETVEGHVRDAFSIAALQMTKADIDLTAMDDVERQATQNYLAIQSAKAAAAAILTARNDRRGRVMQSQADDLLAALTGRATGDKELPTGVFEAEESQLGYFTPII